MEKKLSDEKLDKLLEEQFLKEADLLEEALFSDDLEGTGEGAEEEIEEETEETEEEVEAAYEDLVARLKAKGMYREEDHDSGKVIPMPGNTETVYKIPSDSRKMHRIVRVAGFAAVCVIGVFAASMTSEANRKYFINTMKYLSGDDIRMVIDNDESNEEVDEGENEARKDIKDTLGIEMPRFLYRPKEFEFYSYEINESAEIVFIEYKYRDTIVSLCGARRDKSSGSMSLSLHGKKIATTTLYNGQISSDIFEVKNEGDILPSYTAKWQKEDVSYQLSGKMEKEEFFKLVEKIRFLP